MDEAHFRRSARSAIDLRVTFRLDRPGSELEKAGRVSDLGMGGLRIACQRPPAVQTALVLGFSLPSAWEPLELPAVVRWARADEFGVEFRELGDAQGRALRALLARLEFEEPA